VIVQLQDTRHFAVVPFAIVKYMCVCYLLCYGVTDKINLLIGCSVEPFVTLYSLLYNI